MANAFLNFVIYTSTCSSRVVNVCKNPTISALTRSSLAMRAASVIYQLDVVNRRFHVFDAIQLFTTNIFDWPWKRMFTGHGALAH